MEKQTKANKGTEKMRWTKVHDEILIGAIPHFAPWEHSEGSTPRGRAWSFLAESLASYDPANPPGVAFTPNLSARAVREAYQRIVDEIKRRDRVEEASSGLGTVDEPLYISEAREIQAKFEEKSRVEEENKKAKSAIVTQGAEKRKEALETWKQSMKRKRNDGSSSSSSSNSSSQEKRERRATKPLLQYLETTAEDKQALRKRELDIQERELEMREKQQAFMEEMMREFMNKRK